MTEKRLIQYKVLCDEDEEVARILFEIVETGEEIEGYHQIQEWVNNLYVENEQLKKQREELFIRERDTKNDWRELKQENEQLQKQLSDERKENYGNLDGLNYYQEQNGHLSSKISDLECENEQLKQYKQSVSDVLLSWSQKNLTAKQLQVIIAIMEELNVMSDKND